jgi:hypothetical protein
VIEHGHEHRTRRPIKAARIAYGLTQPALSRYSHPKSPDHFTLPQLAACVLMTFYLDVSYRDMAEFLLASEAVCRALDLPRVPDHSTLSRTYQKLRRIDFETMKGTLLNTGGFRNVWISCEGQADRDSTTSVWRCGPGRDHRPFNFNRQ